VNALWEVGLEPLAGGHAACVRLTRELLLQVGAPPDALRPRRAAGAAGGTARVARAYRDAVAWADGTASGLR
jgi:hypothetical protein